MLLLLTFARRFSDRARLWALCAVFRAAAATAIDSERVERPVSDAHSVVDAIMPDGSRVNFIYGRELSLEGSAEHLRNNPDLLETSYLGG